MGLSLRRLLLRAALLGAALGGVSGCNYQGNLGEGIRGVLAADAARLPRGDAASPGPLAIDATGSTAVGPWGSLPVSLYAPRVRRPGMPGVVFLPGRVAPADQYESYARALASRGIVVAVRGRYGPFRTDEELAGDARKLASYLASLGYVDPMLIGVAGHSMGAKDAILAASGDPRFRAVVAIDPDDNGRRSVVRGPLGSLAAPLLLIGAEIAWKASSICAPLAHNYLRFFERAPRGTIELTLPDADHMQVMDEPDRLGNGICRVSGADSYTIRTLARRATVQFFEEHLLGGEPLMGALGGNAQIRVKH